MNSDTEETRSQMTVTKSKPSTPSRNHMKRKRVAADQIQATIRVIPGNPERIPPLVGYFPSGFNPTRNPDPDSTKVGVFTHKERRGTRLQVVVTPNKESKVDFVGTSYAGEAQAGELCTYGLGILDKATQTLKIVPIASNKIFRLEPKIQGLDPAGKEPASSAIGELSAHDKAEKRIDLLNRYGTKKSIRQNKKMRTLKQEDDPDSQNDLDAIKQGMTDREDTEASEGHKDRNTPPFNASAATPHEAYPLDKIITTGEWKFLQDIYKLSEGGAEISRDSFPEFVCNRVHKLQLIKDADKRNKLSCIFSYITHLIKFKQRSRFRLSLTSVSACLSTLSSTMAVGKNKRISKGKKGGKKKAADPFTKKDWYDIKAPSIFNIKQVGKTLVTRTQGTKIASEGLKHRVFETSLADLQGDEEHAYRKMRLRAEDVQGRTVLTNFWGMNFTTDKLRSLVRKWQTLIEAHVDVKTTDNYTLRMFCIGFTKRRPNQVKRTCYAQSSQIRQIRRKMTEIMVSQATSCDLKDLVRKFIAESIGKEIEKQTTSIYPLQNVFIRKVKILKAPKFDLGKLMEVHGDEDVGTKVDRPAEEAVPEAPVEIVGA